MGFVLADHNVIHVFYVKTLLFCVDCIVMRLEMVSKGRPVETISPQVSA